MINIDTLSNKKATKNHFKESIIRYDYNLIHFSDHARYSYFGSDPWSSSLLFYKHNGKDLMTLYELSNLDFKNFPLLIIDACESSRGTTSKINEPISIIRSLTKAGAIIASNWLSLDSVSFDFARNFYIYILNGFDIAESLFHTRLDLKSLYPNKLYWGIFSLFGNPFIKFSIQSRNIKN